MIKTLKLKNRDSEIKFGGNITAGQIEVEITDDMRDRFAYTYLTKQNLFDIKEHIDKVLQEM